MTEKGLARGVLTSVGRGKLGHLLAQFAAEVAFYWQAHWQEKKQIRTEEQLHTGVDEELRYSGAEEEQLHTRVFKHQRVLTLKYIYLIIPALKMS